MREQARAEGRRLRYDGRWRDRDPAEAPRGRPAGDPPEGAAAPARPIIADRVQGEVRVDNAQLDDMVLLRSDGTPTYMLSVVVDDHRHGHHPRHPRRRPSDQRLPPDPALPRAWAASRRDFAHIPLIHGPDGAKLSQAPRRARRSTDTARWASCPRRCATTCCGSAGAMATTRSSRPSRRSPGSTSARSAGRRRGSTWPSSTSLNAHYLRERPDAELARAGRPLLEALGLKLDAAALRAAEAGMPGLKQRARTLVELADSAAFYVAARPLALDDKAAQAARRGERASAGAACGRWRRSPHWTRGALEAVVPRAGRGAGSASASWRSRCARR